MSAFVFGYGSLTLLGGAAPEHQLRGYVRTWDVAMDNRLDLAGYKYYVDPETGDRPELFVAFLNLRPEPGRVVNGVLLAVAAEELAMIDTRERNYERVLVSDAVTPEPDGEVYAYLGTPAAQARRAEGQRHGRCVIEATYLEAVRDGFRALNDGALERLEASTQPTPFPVRQLERRDL